MWYKEPYINLISTHLLLDWQIGIFLPIGRKSPNQINGSIWKVSNSFFKKIVLTGCHTDVFLKTACLETCLIELIKDLGNEGNPR